MKKTMMKLLSVVMALMMLFGAFSTFALAAAPHEHDKTTKLETIAPRCNAYGYTLYICSCGETWATDIVAKTEGVHSLEAEGKYDTIPASAPSCEADGKSAAKACTWCGKVLEGGEKAGDKTGHDYQWVLVKGDCNTAEKIVYKCVNDNCEKKNDAIPADKTIDLNGHAVDGHNFVYNIVKYPECQLVPTAGGLVTRVADGELVYGYTFNYVKGEAEYECLDCGVKYTGLIVEWNDHTFVKKNNGKVDDCLNFYSEWDECLECGYAKNYVKVDVLNGHLITKVESSCYVAGYEKCTRKGCDYIQSLPLKAHNKAYTCSKCTGVCTDCTHEDRVYKCLTAGCPSVDNATHEKHVWSAQKYYSYFDNGITVTGKYDGVTKFCRPVNLYVVCTNDACVATQAAGYVAADPASADHIKVSYITTSEYFEAKCTTDGYIMVNCLACLQSHIKYEGKAAIDFINAEISRLTAAIASGELVNEDLTTAQAQLAVYNTLKTKQFIKLGHKTIAEITPTGDDKGYQATCTLEGLTDRYVCGRDGCTYVVKEAEVVPVTASAHYKRTGATKADYIFTDSKVKIGQTFPGTCTTPETSYYKCSECKHSIYVKGDFNYFNHVLYGIDELTFTEITSKTIVKPFVSHDAVAVVCGVSDGNYKYKSCQLCDGIVSVRNIDEMDVDGDKIREATDIIYTIADTIIPKAHTFVDQAAQKETCTVDGWNAYQDPCTRCSAPSPKSKKIIPAHGDKYANIITANDAYAPECLKPGVAEGRYCAECDTKNGSKIQTGTKDGNPVYMDWSYKANPDLKNPASTDPWYIAPLGHAASQPHMVKLGAVELAKVTVVKGECVRESFGVRYCTFCVAKNDYDVLNEILLGRSEEDGKKVPADAWVLYDLVDAVDHKYPEAIYEDDAEKNIYKNVTDNFTGVSNFDACVTDKEYYVTCENANCNHTTVAKVEPAKGHYYMNDGKEVIIDLTCTAIDKYADWTCAECKKTVGKDLTAMHSIVEVIKYPGCVAGDHGYRFWACENCDARYFNDDSNPFATPVDPKLPVDDTNPYVETIYVTTTNHDFIEFATVDGKLADKHFMAPTYVADGYVDRNCSKCGTVREILPKLVPTLDVKVESEKATVSAGDTFYVELTYTGDYTKFNALQMDLAYDTNMFKFLSEGFDEELPAGVAVKEENNGKLVVSVFSLDSIEPSKNGAAIKLYFRARANFDKSAVLTITSAMAFGKDGKPIDAKDLTITTSAPAEITSVITGELNGYAGINAGDAIVMMDLIYSKTYNAAADLNKDGAVTVADFAILSKIIATDGSDLAYNDVINTQVTAKTGINYIRIS